VAPAVTAALQSLDGGLVSAAAPGGPVVVRAVSTYEPCPPESETAFDLSLLVGCAHSAPVILQDSDRVELELTTNTPADYGECTVAYCAGDATGCVPQLPDGG
jgi:hypothetical protein